MARSCGFDPRPGHRHLAGDVQVRPSASLSSADAKRAQNVHRISQRFSFGVVARGSVFREKVDWAYRVDAGFHPETGKRRQVQRQGFATKKAAEDALRTRHRASRSSGAAVARSTIRVEEYLTVVESRVAEAASDDPPRLHDVRRQGSTGPRAYQLQSLTPMQIERFYVDHLSNGGRRGGALSPKSVRNVHVVLRKALADAERSVSFCATRRLPPLRRSQAPSS